MDTQTLLIANVLLFTLYAGVMLVNARTVGGTMGAMQFAGANLCRGAAMLVAYMKWAHLAPLGFTQALTGVLAVGGLLLLHQSFAELLERGPMMRWIQVTMMAAIVVIGAWQLLFPAVAVKLAAVLYAILGVQLVVIAAVVFRFSGEQMDVAGWLTGVALSAYAVVQLMGAIVATRYNMPDYPAQHTEMNEIWLVGCLLSSAAIAFGYMALSTAKLRLELLWRAQIDELTGLLNRWALKRVVMKEIQRSRRTKSEIAMLMVDLDGLKTVNDDHGHACGDVILQAVAGVFQETVRAQDSVGRVGGDEFCVLLPETTLIEAMTVAERLRAEVEDLVVQYRGDAVRVRASLGVTSSSISGLGWQSLVDHSDLALYRAKREGRNKVMVARTEDIPPGSDEKKKDALTTQTREPGFEGEQAG
ncbi:MAG TPA: GGDEF domain-containing protein [Edaphobacter sp.]